MEKAPGVQQFEVWGDLNDWERYKFFGQLTEYEKQMAEIRFPASGSLYLLESVTESDTRVALDQETDPEGEFCIGPSCERGWHTTEALASASPRFDQGPCKYDPGRFAS